MKHLLSKISNSRGYFASGSNLSLRIILLVLLFSGITEYSAQNFFPLQTGNTYLREIEEHAHGWQWSGSSWSNYYYNYDSTEVIDPINFQNKTFFKYRDYYYHLDETQNKLFIKIGQEIKLAVDFSAPQGESETLFFNNEMRQYTNSGVYIDTLYGAERSCYKISKVISEFDPNNFYTDKKWIYEYVFVDGIGLYREFKSFEYGHFDYSNVHDTTYTNILNKINSNYFNELQQPYDRRIFLVNDFNVKLSWSHNQSIIDGFTIERRRNDELDYSSIKYLTKDSLKFTDTTLIQGFKYFYRIRANKSGHLSNPQAPLSVVAFKPPEMLYADTTIIDQVSIHWGYNYTDFDGFIVYRKEHQPNSNPLEPPWTVYEIIDTVSADARSYTDTNIYSSLYYMYKVSVFKDTVISLPSGQIFVSPLRSQPNHPIDLSYSFTSDEGIIINWKSANHYPTHYNLERRTVGPFSVFQVINDSALVEPTFLDYDILDSTQYEYRINCFNVIDTSAYSDTISMMSPAFQPLLAPSNCRGTQTDSGTVVIEWEDNSTNESGYVVEYFYNTNPGWIAADTTVMNAERSEHPQPSFYGTITYRIYAFNPHNQSDYFQFNIEIVTSVAEENKTLTFDLLNNYPNPFNPSTKIKYSIPSDQGFNSSAKHAKLVVYDILGNEVAVLVDEVKPPGNYEATWNAANFASGIYIYRLNYGSCSLTKKMTLLK